MSTKEIVYCAHSHETKIYSPAIFQFVLAKGFIPFDPFLVLPCSILELFNFNKEARLEMDLTILPRCDRLWVFSKTGIPPFTPGTTREIEKWHDLGRKEGYFTWTELFSGDLYWQPNPA